MSKSQPDPFESLSDDRSGPTLGAEEMEVVLDAYEQRPDSGLRGAPEMRWLPLAGVAMAVLLGGTLAISARAGQPNTATSVATASKDLAEARETVAPVPTDDSDAVDSELHGTAPVAEVEARAGSTGTKRARRSKLSAADTVLAHGDAGSSAKPRAGGRASAPTAPTTPANGSGGSADPGTTSTPAATSADEAAKDPEPPRGSPLRDLPPPPEDEDATSAGDRDAAAETDDAQPQPHSDGSTSSDEATGELPEPPAA